MEEYTYKIRTSSLPLDDFEEIEELSDSEISMAITSFLAGYDCYDNFAFTVIDNDCIKIYLDKPVDFYEGDLV